MSWVLVPCLEEGRQQCNETFPNRDKSSEGTIGDQAHKGSSSSHNPDKSGNAEYKDGDSKDEVRAWDMDKDLRGPEGVTAEVVVQHQISLLRAGQMPWIRYVIYQRRIWHRRDNFVTRAYTGSNPHTDHVHYNSDFTQAADNMTGTDWHFDDFTVVTVPVDQGLLVVDGELGPKTISKWQQIMGTPVDGRISVPSQLVKAVQQRLNATVTTGRSALVVDGKGIAQDGKKTHTVEALQRYLKSSPIDGIISKPKSEVVRQLQRRLNTGQF